MKAYLVKTPKLIQFLFKKYTWRFATQKKEIFLTFDDGPTKEITDWTLDILKKHNAKATFFCIGKNIVEHPAVFKRIINEHHSIGNHTHNHLKGRKVTTQQYVENTLMAEKEINQYNHQSLKLFRPPYGKIKKKQAKQLRKLGYKIVFWDVLSADFDTTISKEECLKNVLENTEKGSVVVFHDSVKASEKLQYVLPKVLDYFTQKGYIFKAIA